MMLTRKKNASAIAEVTTIAAYSSAGRKSYVVSTIRYPSPLFVPIHSATSAPSTLEVEAIRIAENRYGSDDGHRTYRKTSDLLAESTCMSSIACGSADSRPSTMFTSVG